MKRICCLVALGFAVAAAQAQTTHTVAQLGNVVGDFTAMPPPSASDALNGKLGVQIDARLNYDGSGPINIAAFTDGSVATVFPGQLPQDYPAGNPPPVGGPYDTPAVSIMWDIRSAGNPVDLISVSVFCNNSGSDVRSIPVFDVYTTTDAAPAPGSVWTLHCAEAHTAPAPANLTWGGSNTALEIGGVMVADLTASSIANDVTGLRVDLHAAGFGDELRDPSGGPPLLAVSSPFIGEIDATFGVNAAVSDWALY